jgi:aryl-alcohol dehydrogenase-like predicted oxidoreductase
MRPRPFGPLGLVSPLTLGGAGIGRAYGEVDAEEALATVRAAVDAGIDLVDVAPTYGPSGSTPEAELVIARAFEGRIPAHVRVSSKVQLEDSCPPNAIRRTIRDSLCGTLQRIGRDHLDLLILHSSIRLSGEARVLGTVSVDTVRTVVRPEFEKLVSDGLITCWGLTGTATPDALCELIDDDRPPTAIQSVTNALDSIGELWPAGLPGEPDNSRIRRSAARRGIAVMGIRALAAGGLSGGLDRRPARTDPAARDARRAFRFIEFARAFGVSPAVLAHRYAASLPGVTTLVIGAKTRRELGDALAAGAARPLSSDELAAIEAVAAEQARAPTSSGPGARSYGER